MLGAKISFDQIRTSHHTIYRVWGIDMEDGASAATDALEPDTDRRVSASPPPAARARSSGVAPRASAALRSGAGLNESSRRIIAADFPVAALWSGVCPSESQTVTEARCESSKRQTCQPANHIDQGNRSYFEIKRARPLHVLAMSSA
jgi:hypothetical protein